MSLPGLSTPSNGGSDGQVSESTATAAAVDGQLPRCRLLLPMLELGTYDGRTLCGTFLAKFENCSDYYSWNGRERLCHLRASLEKDAGQVLWDTRRPLKT